MQKRHFEMVAATLAGMPDRSAAGLAAHAFARDFARINSKFNRAIWFRACNVEG